MEHFEDLRTPCADHRWGHRRELGVCQKPECQGHHGHDASDDDALVQDALARFAEAIFRYKAPSSCSAIWRIPRPDLRRAQQNTVTCPRLQLARRQASARRISASALRLQAEILDMHPVMFCLRQQRRLAGRAASRPVLSNQRRRTPLCGLAAGFLKRRRTIPRACRYLQDGEIVASAPRAAQPGKAQYPDDFNVVNREPCAPRRILTSPTSWPGTPPDKRAVPLSQLPLLAFDELRTLALGLMMY